MRYQKARCLRIFPDDASTETLKYSNIRKVSIIVLCIFEAFLFGAIIFGWGSLAFVYQKEGIYYDLCEPKNLTAVNSSEAQDMTTCVKRDQQFSLVYSIGIIIFTLSFIPVGQLLDRKGIFVSRNVTLFISAAGLLLLSLTSIDVPWLMFPGFILLCIGNSGFVSISGRMGALGGKNAGIAVSFINVGLNFSIWTFSLIQIAYDAGIHYKYSFGLLIGLLSMYLLNTIVLFPKTNISEEPKENSVAENTEVESPEEGAKGVKYYLLSSENILMAYWFAINYVRFSFFIANLNAWLGDRTNNDTEKVAFYLTILGYVQLGGIILSPALGKLSDFLIKQLPENSDLLWLKARAFVMILCICPISSVLMGICMIVGHVYHIDSDIIVPLTYVFYIIHKTGIFMTKLMYVGRVFPGRYFGTILSCMLVCGGLSSSSSYGLVLWMQSDQLGVDLLLLVMTATTLIHPIIIYIKWRRRRKL